MIKNAKNLVERTILPEIIKHLEKPEITLIIGSRQVGKTTLLFQLKDFLLKKGYLESEILFFNLDLMTDLMIFERQDKFIDFLKERMGSRKLFVFVDEAQRIKNAGIFFKGIYDFGLPIKFILTGSSVLEIKAKIHESLMGRKRIFHLYPFSFQEYLSCQDKTLTQLILQKEISSVSQEILLKHLFDFIIWGGYPRVVLESETKEKYQLLKEIYSTYLERDVIGFLKIKDPLTFTKFFNLLAGQIGQLVNFYEFSNTVAVTYRTLEKYFDILEKTFVIKLIHPFFKNRRKELTKMPKVFFLDTGIRNFALDSFKDFETHPAKGSLLENFVFSEISKNSDLKINFWRTKDKAEVDFVLETRSGTILPIEVKAGVLKKPAISRNFQSFIKKYQPKKSFLVNLGFQGQMKFDHSETIFIHPYEIKRVVQELN